MLLVERQPLLTIDPAYSLVPDGIIDPVVARVYAQYAVVPYKYDMHPGFKQVSMEDLVDTGMNCELATHYLLESLILDKTGKHAVLPDTLRAAELWMDQQYSRKLTKDDSHNVGDIFFFGAREIIAKEKEECDIKDFYQLHLAIFVGVTDKRHPLLFHASYGNRGIQIDSQERVQFDPRHRGRHEIFYGRKRLDILE